MTALSPTYESAYLGLLEEFGKSYSPRGKRNWTPFWPAIGSRYMPARGVLVVGRATNGWEVPGNSTIEEYRRPMGPISLCERAKAAAGTTFLWDSAHYAHGGTIVTRSAFWRVARQVVIDLLPEERERRDWPETIAWSNLSKIAPSDPRNPPWGAYKAQWRHVGPLVRAEAEDLRPSVVLVLAGSDWADPLTEVLGVQRFSGIPTASRDDSGTVWVLAGRPEYKGEAAFLEGVRHAIANADSR
jgi:hypothetical protein